MRSGDFTDTSHLLPKPPQNPWNSSSLAWTSSYSGLMEFSAQVPFNSKSFQHQKRKSEYTPILPTKQLITEDKMAAHLNSLHISKDFTAHNSNTFTEEPIPGTSNTAINDTDSMNTADLDYLYPINNPKELEEKLKRANRITVCNEIKNLQQDNILPKALLNHYQKPCTALVIWQPPQKMLGLFDPEQNNSDDSDSDDAITDDIAYKNMSALSLNNYSMDTDL